MQLTAEQKQKLKKAIDDPATEFIFIPSATLKERIAKGNDPHLAGLSPVMCRTFLEMPHSAAIAIDKTLVMKYVTGEIDKGHDYVFSLGELRVLDDSYRLDTANNKSTE